MKQSYKISVIIPVKNEEMNIRRCLDSILGQKIDDNFEIIIIDSGSTDGTLDILKQYAVAVYQIKADEFGHGKTRQFGATLAKGDLLVFTVADAVPSNNLWLMNLAKPLMMDSSTAATYGMQAMFPNAKYSDIENNILYAGLDSRPRIQSVSDQDAYNLLSPLQRRMLCNFDNCNSCIRKSVLLRIPFDDVCYAEDFLWCKKSILAGYVIAFVPEAVVYHYHYQSFKYAFLRNCYDAILSIKTFDMFSDECFTTLFGRLVSGFNHLGQRRIITCLPWLLNRLKVNFAIFFALHVALMQKSQMSRPILYKFTQPIRDWVISRMTNEPIIHE